MENSLEFKALSGQLNVDEAKGIVECFVAAVGNKDSVGDIVAPGAFDGSLKRRTPRVVWGHDWNHPIGKVLEIYEVGPKDNRLPQKMREAGVGGVYARVQFNLKSERGREAFNSVLFFGEDQEWSIGYKTLDSIYSPERQANVLKEVELYEVSPVLHGANQLTGTISIKSANGEGSRVTSFRKSQWPRFDVGFAQRLKDDYPEIWAKGGNIRGNDQWEILSKIHRNGGTAETEDQIKALELREAWIARHKGDFRLPGVIAQIKWLAVGEQGEAEMKKVVREAIAKMEGKKAAVHLSDDFDDFDDIEEKGHGMMMGVDPEKVMEMAEDLADELDMPVRIIKVGRGMVKFEAKDEDDNQILKFISKWRMGEDGFEFFDFNRVKPIQSVEQEMEREDNDSEEMGREEMSGWPEDYPEMKKPGCGCGCGGKGNCGDSMLKSAYDDFDIKAPIPPDVIPQERITGDVLRGYGPRRGNLERLLRYWRPIMRKPGGFRRCRVILANHPELYPLNNICAWLHHETTGLWPNEGCHHPTMKNCRRKLKRVVRGSLWSDSEFNARLNRLGGKKKDAMGGWVMPERDEDERREEGDKPDMSRFDFDGDGEITQQDFLYAIRVLSEFMDEEKEFVDYLREEKNWMHEGMDDEGSWKTYEPEPGWSMKDGCGCGDDKSEDEEIDSLFKSLSDFTDVKVGRKINAQNMGKIRQAISLLQEIIDGLNPAQGIEMKSDGLIEAPVESLYAVRETIDPVVDYYGLDVEISEEGVHVKDFSDLTDEAKSAISAAIGNFGIIQSKGIGTSFSAEY